MINLMLPSVTKVAPIHALVIGKPKSGKTRFAITWPKPLLFNFDNNCPEGVEEYPFWDTNFLDAFAKRTTPSTPSFRDALINFTRKFDEVPKDRTIIVDSLSLIEAMYTAQEEYSPKPMVKLKDGGGMAVDKQTLFYARKAFYEQFLVKLRNYPGNVLCLVHQYDELNEDGRPTGFIYPAIQGQMKVKISGFFNNVWQSVCKDLGQNKYAYVLRMKNNPSIGLATSFKCDAEELPAHYDAFKPLLGIK